jgi:GDPmannose 4,6-dehydratase
MTTALITGAAGQDGLLLGGLLKSKGYRIIAAVLPGSGQQVEGAEAVEWPAEDQQAMTGVIARFAPDEIYNLAAMSFSPACEADPVAATDILGMSVLRLLEAMRQAAPRARLFQASSSEMFGSPAEDIQDETTPLVPRTVYGMAKVLAHRMCGWYRERHGLFACCGILYAHESPLRGEQFLSRKVARAAARIARGLDRELVLGNVEAERDWTDARDTVQGMWSMLQAKNADDYILASGCRHTVADMCATAFARVGLDWRSHVRSDPALIRKEPRGLCGNPRRAYERLGWKPARSFQDMVWSMVDAELALLSRTGGL